jgi:alginate O-acetyltransferase complex protein AlgI
LWHGAAYTFVIWGAIHGGWLALERAARRLVAPGATEPGAVIGFDVPERRPAPTLAARMMSRLWTLAGWATTMLVVFVGWVFFRAASVGEATALLARACALDELGATPEMLAITPYLLTFLALHVPLHMLHVENGRLRLGLAGKLATTAWLFVAAIVLGAGEVNEFIYFQF